MQNTKYIDDLVQWYRYSAKLFFDEFSPERVGPFDEDFVRLDALRKAAEIRTMPVCFLGQSGVGKSTLINALVGADILPQGGVGPLTAQATSVCYAEEKYFRVEYLQLNRVYQMVFALERHLEAELRRAEQALTGGAEELTALLDEEERAEAAAAVPHADDPQRDVSKIQGYEKQARLLIRGNQFDDADLPYVLDALRRAIGQPNRWSTELAPEDLPRVDGITSALRLAGRKQPLVHRMGDDEPAFRANLKTHASGYLAPLIKTLEVGWDAEFLRGGVRLIDLPGLGVANDEYRNVTNEAIRSAHAIVLVVDKSGVTEDSASLLHTTGFINSLLHESHDPNAEPVSLLVAVVKLDLSADDARSEERNNVGREAAQPWLAHFENVCERATPMVQGQLRTELLKIVDQGPDSTRRERHETVESVLRGVEVHPLSAIEFRKFLEQDEDSPARIKKIEQSRVPALLEAITARAAARNERIDDRILRLAKDLHARNLSALEVIAEQWREDTRAEDEIRQLREELDRVIEPLQKEFDTRRGAFRQFLRQDIPERISARVGEATGDARLDMLKFLRGYEDYHWSTLRAAVRRGGVFVGSRKVDLPNELTLRFEESVAVIWGKHIITALRKETGGLGSDYAEMVGRIVEWARAQGGRVQPKLVEALHEELKGNARQLSAVGKEAIDELKKKVKTQLYSKVESRIRKRCQKFVDDNQHQGPGVKRRILAMLKEDLVEVVVESARPVATDVLQKNYQIVQEEISSLFQRYENPLTSARDQIVASNEVRIKRGDKKRKGAVLEKIESVVAVSPKMAEV